MIDNKYIKMLGSGDAEIRKVAIKELAKLKDPAVLPYLAKVFRSDDDPEVREMARKAGAFLKKQTSEQAQVVDEKPKRKPLTPVYADDDEDDDAPAPALYDDKEEDAEPEVEVVVSARDRDFANGMVQSALDANMRGDNDRAAKYLAQALQKNPTLKHDSYTRSLAGSVLGVAGDEAVRRLSSPEALKPKEKRKRKNDEGGDDGEPSWSDALINLGIYGLVNMGIVAIAMIVGARAAIEVLQQMAASPSTAANYGLTGVDVNQIISIMTTAGVPVLLIYSGIAGIIAVIALLVWYFFVHITSSVMLGGDGTMPRLIDQTALFLAFGTPIYQVVLAGGQIALLSNPDLMGLYWLFNLALFVGFSLWLSDRIGKAYRFGMGRGCSAIILSYIVMVVTFCACGWLILSSLSSQVSAGF